ncbi:putative uncharacterized protein [Roseburia sp. CAG:309]|nr:putative uncharacterized protein [Roseburia sp. CAG:309]
MYSCQLNMLHNSRYKSMFAICDRICLAFHRVTKETVDQDWTVRCHAYGCCHILFQAFRIIDYFHTTSAEYIRWTHHNRITDLICNFKCFFHIYCHTCFRHWNVQFFHHAAEQITVFCHINDLRRSSEDIYSVFLQICCQIQWCLSTKLCDDTEWLLFFIYTQNIFKC